jgi:hypothetical protein
MARIKGTNNAQSLFLRACLKDPSGMANEKWPSATVLRKWMRRRGFRVAIKGIRDSLRFQAEMHVASASASAAKCLAQVVGSDQELTEAQRERLRAAKEQIASLTTLLRLAHLRSRFSAEAPEPPATPVFPPEVRDTVREIYAICSTTAHEDVTIGKARELYKQMGRDPHEWIKHVIADERKAASANGMTHRRG